MSGVLWHFVEKESPAFGSLIKGGKSFHIFIRELEIKHL